MELNLDNEAAMIETILFLESDPVETANLCKISGLDRNVVEATLEYMKELYVNPTRGLELIEMGGGWMLSPKKNLWDQLKDRYGKKNEQKLSKAALETLSIIAYRQPITKAEVEGIRGVSADNMIHFLLDKNLIKESGKKDAPGRPLLYGTTKEFLKFFRLASISDLPKLGETDSDRFEIIEEEKEEP